MINPEQHWMASSNVVYCDLENSVALLDTDRNVYFALDGIGPFIWEYIIAGASVNSLSNEVLSAFDVDKATAHADISEIIQKMAGAGLIEANSGGA